MDRHDTPNSLKGAFACVDSEHQYLQVGLTKREYISTQVFAAFFVKGTSGTPISQLADESVAAADKLLKALEK